MPHWKKRRQFNRLALTTLFGGFALLAIALLAIVTSLRQGQRGNALTDHTYQVISQFEELAVLIERAENARRGYLLLPSGTRNQLARDSASTVMSRLYQIDQMTADNPEQQRRIDAIRPTILSQLGQIERSLRLAETGRVEEARAQFRAQPSQSALRRIRAFAHNAVATERRLLAERIAAEGRSQAKVRTGIIAAGVILLALLGATIFLMRRYVNDLTQVTESLRRLNEELEHRVDERTADLTRANEEVQRFAYIVSHDLRSPLVNIMGFTSELAGVDKMLLAHLESVEASDPSRVPENVRLAVREDLPEAIQFIRSSTEKMDRLINAILTISREGRRRVEPETLDLDQMADGIARSLQVVADGRGATIRVEHPLPALVSDRLAVEQILSNLVENGTKYGEPGRPGEVVLSGRSDGDRVILTVRDNGRGVAAGDQERIFELFRRAGRQDQAGEGIGLANVRALAYRLGGTVTISSVLHEGSSFEVNLPAVLSVEGGK